VNDRVALPAEAEVRAAMAHLLQRAAADGIRPTAVALAARLGISRPALYRHFRPVVEELLTTATAHEEARRRRIRDCNGELAQLKLKNADLRRHVELYEEIVRQLTINNDRLRQRLEERTGVTHIDSHRI
jgi:DNA-binding transcriptional ArsR family regulator